MFSIHLENITKNYLKILFSFLAQGHGSKLNLLNLDCYHWCVAMAPPFPLSFLLSEDVH